MAQEKKMPSEAWVALHRVMGYLDRAKRRVEREIDELKILREDAEEKKMWGYVASLRSTIEHLDMDAIRAIEMAYGTIERLTKEYGPGG